jgi:uncharacterized phage protein (TIGR01671 family)
MTREIKFRAWDKKNKKFIENFVIDNNGTCYTGEEILDIELIQSTGLFDKNGVEIYEGDILRVEHKAYRGEEQYSSKLIESFTSTTNFICKYEEGQFRLHSPYTSLTMYDFSSYEKDLGFCLTRDIIKNNDRFGHFSKDIFAVIGIVGNIHQNPELLK